MARLTFPRPPQLWARSIRLLDYKEKPRGWASSAPQSHAGHEFVYVDRGSVRAMLGGRTLAIGPGECLIIRERVRHAFAEIEGRPYSILNLVYAGRLPRALANRVLLLRPLERTLLKAAWGERKTGAPHADHMVLLKLNEFLVTLVRRQSDGAEPRRRADFADNRFNYRQHVAQQALGFLQERLAEPLDTEAVARHVNLSGSRLRALVRRETGRPLRQHLRSMRLEEARRLLHESPYNVQEIALRVGYQSVTHFSNVFRRDLGMTPSQYTQSLWAPPDRNA